MRTTQRPCALLLALLCLCSAPWRFMRQYVRAYDPCEAAMRNLLCCYVSLLLAGELVRSQEPASCLDRRVLLNTGKEYLRSLVAKLIPKYVKDYISGLPQEEFKGMREIQDYP
ncbi:uncharacterized protein LOC142577766 isoform X2 [Dermacentor variabilis]|uniref:uncharacterized protein LOC142577766 isoform X2 n=1 Tax=Dermacentor variabilis TaxID=34621 RepID=UPI003F5C5018